MLEENQTNIQNQNQTQTDKFIKYNCLMELYIKTIIDLLDVSYGMKILPFKAMIGINWIKEFILANRFEILRGGLDYLLENKELVLNFNIDKLDELDIDSNDNMSVKSCVSRFKNLNKFDIPDKNNTLTQNSDDMLELIINVKNNSKKLSRFDVGIIKKYFELLINILEQIKQIFI